NKVEVARSALEFSRTTSDRYRVRNHREQPRGNRKRGQLSWRRKNRVARLGNPVVVDRQNGGSVHPGRLSYDLHADCAFKVSRRNTQGPIGGNDPDVCDNPTSHRDTRAEGARSKADEPNCSENRFGETHTDLLPTVVVHCYQASPRVRSSGLTCHAERFRRPGRVRLASAHKRGETRPRAQTTPKKHRSRADRTSFG